MAVAVRWTLLWCLVLLPALAWGQPGSTLNREAVSIINPLEYGVTCTSGTLNAAISGAPASQRELWLTTKDRNGSTCVWAITSNVTIPNTMTLRVPKGATVAISSGITLAILGPHVIDSANWRTGLGSVTYSLPTSTAQGSFVSTGCLPVVPSSSLTMAGFGCVVTLADGLSHLPLAVPAAAITLAGTAGTHWLAVHRDTTTAVSGWTRQTGTHYLHRTVATQPTELAGLHIIARITVAGSVITAVKDRRKPASFARAGVFDYRDPLYGGIADCTEAGVGTDQVGPIRAAGAAAQEQGGVLKLGGWMCVGDQITFSMHSYQEGFQIIGERWQRASEDFPEPHFDTRIWSTITDPAKSVFRFQQDTFTPGGSFSPVILRDFGVQAASGVRGLTRGLKAYGIAVQATNVGANYFLIGWDIEEANGPHFYSVTARKNKATNMRLFNVYEPLLMHPYFPEAHTQYHGASPPYTGVGLTLSGVYFGRIQTPHLSGSPVGMTVDGTGDLVIDQPYFEQNENGAGTLQALTAGITTQNTNLKITNAHCQDPSAQWHLDRVIGGRMDVCGHTTRTDRTLNVDLVSTVQPTLNPFTDTGPPAHRQGQGLMNPNYAPDGHFIHQPLFANIGHYMIDNGGAGSATRTWVGYPAFAQGLAPGRKYLRLNTTGSNRTFIYPTSLGNHSIKAGTRVYFQVWYYIANTPAASVRMELSGVDSGGAAVGQLYTETLSLTSTTWANMRYAFNVPTTGGMDTLNMARLFFETNDPGDVFIGAISVSLRPEPTTFSFQDAAFGFVIQINDVQPAIFPDIGPPDYVISATAQESGKDVWVDLVGTHWEVHTTSTSAINVNLICLPQQHRGY